MTTAKLLKPDFLIDHCSKTKIATNYSFAQWVYLPIEMTCTKFGVPTTPLRYFFWQLKIAILGDF